VSDQGLTGNLRGAVDLSSLTQPPAPPAASGAVTRAVSDSTFNDVIELSKSVPVIVEFHGQGIESSLGPLIEQYGGRLALATVDAPVNPQLAQAFQVREIPVVFALMGGAAPIPLFVGIREEQEVRAVLDQVLQVAAQQGVTGTVSPADDTAEPEEAPLPPHHQAAYDAIDAGDLPAAIKAYETAIAQDPRDHLAVAGLAQVSLLARIAGASADEVRKTAADAPADPDAQLAVADLDVAGGHLDDAFARLLDLFPSLAGEDRDRVRTRLLAYFEIGGAEDPRVIAGRRRLTALLY
jgi:putative thioredoxin